LFFILQKVWTTSANTTNFGLPKTRDFVPMVKFGGDENLLDVLMKYEILGFLD
jgi:hypothetical protein